MAKAWYFFMGGADADNKDVLNYHKLTVKHTCLCGIQLCAIYANDGGIHPSAPLSPNMMSYIDTALATTQIQPEVPYDAKKYVYLKH